MMKPWQEPRYRGLVIRKNADDLSDWIDRANEMYRSLKVKFVGKPAVVTFPSGARIRTGHLKDDNSFGKYIGHEYQRMLIEEATQIPTEELYLKLISSCRSTIEGLSGRVFLTTNPSNVGHLWIKKRFVDVAPPKTVFKDPDTGRSRIFIPAKVTDNPTLMRIDPNYVKSLDGLPEQLRAAWRDGSWDSFIGQYFRAWDRNKHVCTPFKIPKHWKKYRSIDYGSTSPSAVYWWAVNEEGRSFCYRELYEAEMTYEQLADRIKKMTPPDEEIEYTVVDPAITGKREQKGNIFITGSEIMGNHGVHVRKGDNSRIEGWRRFQSFLEMNAICFFDTCVKAIETIPSMVHDKVNIEDLDTKSEDHAVDSIRYYIMSRPRPANAREKPFEPISYDQRVFNYVKKRRVQLKKQRARGTSRDTYLGDDW